MAKTIAKVETQHGAAYAKRLCRHFAHKIPATVEDRHALIEFPFGPCNIDVDDSHMHIVVELSDENMIDRAESVVADHLVRMANKDEPVVNWVRVSDE